MQVFYFHVLVSFKVVFRVCFKRLVFELLSIFYVNALPSRNFF